MDDKLIIKPEQYDTDQSILNKSRSDKYMLIMSVPEALRNHKSTERDNSKVDFDSLQFSVTGSPTPDIIIPAVGEEYAGQELKISSHSRESYETVFVTFTIDNLYRNWWVIYSWLDLLNDEGKSHYNAKEIANGNPWEAMKQYTADFTIYGLDEYNNNVIRFDYEGCFPVSLQSPKYSDDDPTIIKSQFEFAFTFFKATLV